MDLLHVRAKRVNGTIDWEFVDPALNAGNKLVLDQPTNEKIEEGDEWQVHKVADKGFKKKKSGESYRRVTIRLITKIRARQRWEDITNLEEYGHWISGFDLKCLFSWLHAGTDVILIGPKGTGKTQLGYAICRALGWQEPCKVDMTLLKNTSSLFGSDAAGGGKTFFARSELYDYTDRAWIAYQKYVEGRKKGEMPILDHFLLILDEINRLHSKSADGLHGMYDDTRQVSFVTTEGTKIIKLPPNIHTIGTMNLGYVGTYQMDEALKDRFALLRVQPMPEDAEIALLVKKTGVTEKIAGEIVMTMKALREAERAKSISEAPSFRSCCHVAQLVRDGNSLRNALVRGFCEGYEGYNGFDEKGVLIRPEDGTEAAMALNALQTKGLLTPPTKKKK